MTSALLIIGLLGAMAGMAFKYATKWSLARDRLQFFAAEYERALHAGDQRYALAAGRSYYDILRGGIRTQEDEELIKNDVALMELEESKTIKRPFYMTPN